MPYAGGGLPLGSGRGGSLSGTKAAGWLYNTIMAAVDEPGGRSSTGRRLALGRFALRLASLQTNRGSAAMLSHRIGLGTAYVRCDQPEKAIPLLVKGMADAEHEFGADDPYTCDARQQLIRAYRKVGRNTDAMRLAQQASPPGSEEAPRVGQ
jgi:hypothetical protein